MDLDITITDAAGEHDSRELRDALHEFNFATTGYRDGKSLSCFLRDEHGTLIAGIDGFTWGGYAWIDILWVDASVRGEGIGRRLLEAAEAEARARGCRTIALQTHGFQAPEFYPRLGYTIVGETTETPAGSNQLLFQKPLASAS